LEPDDQAVFACRSPDEGFTHGAYERSTGPSRTGSEGAQQRLRRRRCLSFLGNGRGRQEECGDKHQDE